MAKKALNIMPVKGASEVPVAKVRRYYEALAKGEGDKVAIAMHEYLSFFETLHFTSYSQDDLHRLDTFVSVVIAAMADPAFILKGPLAVNLIATNHLLCNLVATSAYGTTDGILKQVLRQQDNLLKVLFLYNQRCETVIDVKSFFDVEPQVASLWYTTYSLGTSNPSEIQLKNLQRHAEGMDERFVAPHRKLSCMYFTNTYLAPLEDRRFKGIINQACKNRFVFDIKSNPNPKKIAIVSAKWHRNHAVYKSAAPLVNQLRDEYDLTLVHLGESVPKNLVTEGFEKVINAKFNESNLKLPPELMENQFGAIYYPDLGMNDEGLWLSNCRIAPIQVMGYGHPATSGDHSEIDYFIGGDCEKGVGHCYGEQMILIPGLAQAPMWPQYERKNNWEQQDELQINCVWGPDKYNYNMLSVLREISRRAWTPHKWNFFPSPGIHRYAGFVPFLHSVSKILPNSFVHADKEYYPYMEAAEKGDLSLNSFPFGGYNTVVESLFLGLPIVTLEGDRYYNRAASYLLRSIGMGELSHHEPEDFIKCCVNMIDNENDRLDYRAQLEAMDLKTELFRDDKDKHFLQAFKYIFANHPIEKTDNPILIGATT